MVILDVAKRLVRRSPIGPSTVRLYRKYLRPDPPRLDGPRCAVRSRDRRCDDAPAAPQFVLCRRRRPQRHDPPDDARALASKGTHFAFEPLPHLAARLRGHLPHRPRPRGGAERRRRSGLLRPCRERRGVQRPAAAHLRPARSGPAADHGLGDSSRRCHLARAACRVHQDRRRGRRVSRAAGRRPNDPAVPPGHRLRGWSASPRDSTASSRTRSTSSSRGRSAAVCRSCSAG